MLTALVTAILALSSGAVSSNTNSYTEATGNGSVTAFTFTMPTQDRAWIKVRVAGVLQTTGYTLVLNANQDTAPGGTVTFSVAPTAGQLVRIERTVPYGQATVLTPYSAFPAKTVERAMDRLAMQVQQLNDREVGVMSSASVVRATGASADRSLADRFADTVSVKDFGAVGNGIADDTAAIQAAISSGTVGREIVFPPGTYLVTARITLPAGRSVRLVGAGPSSIVTRATAGEVFYRASRGDFTEIDSLTFTGAAIAFRYDSQETPLPQVGEYYEAHIRNCRFLQAATTYALSFHGVRETLIERSYFETNMGAYLDYSINVDFQSCYWKNTVYGVRAFTGSEGIKILGGMMMGTGTGVWFGSDTTGLQIVGAMLDYNDIPVIVDSATAVLITGSYISSRTVQPAIYVRKSTATVPAGIRIVGNYLRQNSADPANRVIRIEDSSNVQVAFNTVEGWRGNGIEYTASTDVTLAFNSITPLAGSGAYSISAGTDSASTKIHGNTLGKPLSVTAAVDRFGNTGDTLSHVVNGLQVSGGPFNPPSLSGAAQANAVYQGSGVPSNALGGNGDLYFRTDTPGTASQRVYVKSAGAWVGIL